jgi:hypothetical protein
LWTEGLNEKVINKEMFPVYSWKCLSRKAVPLGGNFFADDEDIETEVRK